MRKKHLISNCKKGNAVIDIITVAIILLVMAVSSVFVYAFFDDINTDVQNDPDLFNQSKESVNTLHTQFPTLLDGIFVFVFAFLWVALLLSSFVIDSHPVFFFAGFILLGFVIFLGAVFSNTYEEISNEDEFLNFTDGFPMTNFIMDQLPIAIVIIGMSVLIALYAKSRLGV